MPTLGKAQRTRDRLVRVALELFEADGFDTVSVGRIAQAAGVTEMTFYRNFPTKERVVLDDPFDPLIADAVAGQAADLPALAAVAAGVRGAWNTVDFADMPLVRSRLRVIASSPRLRSAMGESTSATTDAIDAALRARGVAGPDAAVAAAAAVAALTAALINGAHQDDVQLTEAIDRTLAVLAGER